MSLDCGWRTVVVVASGPSLNSEQCATIAQAQRAGRVRVIVINNSFELIPTADVLYAGDGAWWHMHKSAVDARFTGELWTQDHKASVDYGLHWIEAKPGAGIHPDPDKVYQGSNSGHVGVCLARLFGAQRIVLCGFDMQVKPGGPAHWHGAHPYPLGNGNPAGFIKHFDTLAPQLKADGIEVVNASRETALKCFPRRMLREALA